MVGLLSQFQWNMAHLGEKDMESIIDIAVDSCSGCGACQNICHCQAIQKNLFMSCTGPKWGGKTIVQQKRTPDDQMER